MLNLSIHFEINSACSNVMILEAICLVSLVKWGSDFLLVYYHDPKKCFNKSLYNSCKVFFKELKSSFEKLGKIWILSKSPFKHMFPNLNYVHLKIIILNKWNQKIFWIEVKSDELNHILCLLVITSVQKFCSSKKELLKLEIKFCSIHFRSKSFVYEGSI